MTVLQERARRLAEPLRSDTAAIDSMLCFTVGGERFLVPLRALCEVAPLERVTPVPGLPALFAGLGALRGALIPVLDLRQALGVHASRPERPTHVLVVDEAGSLTGIWADRVEGLVPVRPATLSSDHSPDRPGCLGRTPDLATVIDLGALLAAARGFALPPNPKEA